ncbi:helix-turn-helix domain-containing protein [Flavobacterium wongokense]|uniref:helix-turn-helix domain-containing protein n=1 Tax=Flavobacterium wongokense TaxID=2910674 RepID=UPI001F2401B6|nr:helix-turn-helix domain-containing protein [Flavobacterium sp. WG47]MCF6133134.1 helix-turn-helix domain-containing protein [Flavobacterium sp. WG47]
MATFLIGTSFLFSQKGEETSTLIQKAKIELYINPGQSLKITEYILHNYDYSNKVLVQCNSLLANYYFVTGKYALAVDNVMLAVKQLSQIDDKSIKIETLLQAAEIFSFLDLYEASSEYIAIAKKMANGDIKWEKKIKNYELLYAKSYTGIDTYLRLLKETNPNQINDYASLAKGTITTQLAEKYLENEKVDSAAFYFSRDITNNAKNIYWEMIADLHYSDCDFKTGNYQNAVKALKAAFERATIFKNPYFDAAIYEKWAKNYLALKDKEKYREFSLKASVANNLLNTEKTLAVNAAFDKLQNEESENVTLVQEHENRLLWVLGIAVVIVAFVWLFIRWQYQTRINYTSNIVNYLKLIKATEIKPDAPEKLILKSNQRPKETDELLLSKLAKFETGNKYLSKDISLAQLASQFDTNTKYLSEVINQYKEKNFNVYINELRIHYIVNKLKTDPIYLSYKVSYLAEECGFSTHSSFSTVFKNITGITPNVFIQFLTQDKIEENNVFSLN